MGTKCAPTHASLFMGLFEQVNIMPKIKDLILLYVRYIDDIFFVWKGMEQEKGAEGDRTRPAETVLNAEQNQALSTEEEVIENVVKVKERIPMGLVLNQLQALGISLKIQKKGGS